MTFILLVRHAHTDWVGRGMAGRAAGLTLSEDGRREAVALGRRLAGLPLSVVYTSPLERATATAIGMVGPRAIPIVTCEALNEMDFGEWTGRQLEEVERDARWREFSAHGATVAAPGGESMAQLRERVVGALERLAREHPRSLLAVVTHAEPIRAAVLHYLGAPYDLRSPLDILPASVTAISLGDGATRVLCVNDVGNVAAMLAAAT